MTRGTILVAEDEPMVRRILLHVLTREDYDVLEADSAEEALTLSNLFEGAIDLLITDHLLKTLTGREVAEHIRLTRPLLKVLHISGHSLEHLEEEGGILPGAGFLPKPFLPTDLREKVREILGAVE